MPLILAGFHFAEPRPHLGSSFTTSSELVDPYLTSTLYLQGPLRYQQRESPMLSMLIFHEQCSRCAPLHRVVFLFGDAIFSALEDVF